MIQRFCVVTVLLATLLIPSRGVADQRRHLVTIDDMMSLKTVDWELGISPDGKVLAYVIGDQLWLLDTEHPIPWTIGNGTMPVWSPKGGQLAFYSNRSGDTQLWLFDVDRGKTTQLTSIPRGINPDPTAGFSGWIGDPLRFRWSPDGTRIAFTSRMTAPKEGESPTVSGNGSNVEAGSSAGTPMILTSTTPPEFTLSRLFSSSLNSGAETGPPKSRFANQVFTVDINSHVLQQVTHDSNGYFNPDWYSDGTKLLLVSTEGRPMVGAGPDSSNLYAVGLTDGRRTPLTNSPGQKRMPTWSPNSQWIAYMSGKWTGITSVLVLAKAGGEPINVTAQLDRNIFSYQWSPDSASVLVSYQDGASVSIARIAVPSGQEQELINPQAFCHPFVVSDSGKLVWIENNESSPGVLYVSDTDGKHERVLLDLYPEIKNWALGKQTVVRWRNGRGEQLEGILIKPVRFEEGKRYPLIVDPYPGQVNSFFASPMLGNQGFASRGYAVFFPNERTPHTWENPVKGEDYNNAAQGTTGLETMMDDLTTGIDELIRRGIADPERMCLYGFSNGGGAVNQILTKTDRFKCAVSASGVATDWIFSFFMTGNSTFPDLVGGRAPWDDPEAYVKLSPVFHLDRIKTPVLLVVGDDEETGVLMVAEMYNGLRYLGRDVTMLRYPKQGHGLTGDSLRDYWRRANAFLDSYLLEREIR